MIYIVSAGSALLTTVCLYLYLLKTGYFVMNGDAHASLAEENIVLPDTEDPDEEEDNKEVPEENDAEEEIHTQMTQPDKYRELHPHLRGGAAAAQVRRADGRAGT